MYFEELREIVSAINFNMDSKEGFYRDVMTISKIIGRKLDDCVKVKRSTIHGKGVFAKRDIYAGEIVTIYPIHGVITKKCIYANNRNTIERYSKEYSTQGVNIIDDYVSYVGDPTNESEGIGHFVNDSAGDYFYIFPLEQEGTNNPQDIYTLTNDPKDKIRFRNIIYKYYLKAKQTANCTYYPCGPLIVIKALKDIKENEELLCTYSAAFWFKRRFPNLNFYDLINIIKTAVFMSFLSTILSEQIYT